MCGAFILKLSSTRTPWTITQCQADWAAFRSESSRPVALMRALHPMRLLATSCHHVVHVPLVGCFFSPRGSDGPLRPSVRLFFTWVATVVGAVAFASVGEYLTMVVSKKTTFIEDLGGMTAGTANTTFGNMTNVDRTLGYRFDRATSHIFRQLREERDAL